MDEDAKLVYWMWTYLKMRGLDTDLIEAARTLQWNWDANDNILVADKLQESYDKTYNLTP
jgi:hypothetical protein